MHPLVLVFLLSASDAPLPAAGAAVDSQALATCTAQRLRTFVGPFGVQQKWPTVPQLPPELTGQLGEVLSDQGAVGDGYMQRLIVDSRANSAYVVQVGGFAGFQTVYGPLPVGACAVVAP